MNEKVNKQPPVAAAIRQCLYGTPSEHPINYRFPCVIYANADNLHQLCRLLINDWGTRGGAVKTTTACADSDLYSSMQMRVARMEQTVEKYE